MTNYISMRTFCNLIMELKHRIQQLIRLKFMRIHWDEGNKLQIKTSLIYRQRKKNAQRTS